MCLFYWFMLRASCFVIMHAVPLVFVMGFLFPLVCVVRVRVGVLLGWSCMPMHPRSVSMKKQRAALLLIIDFFVLFGVRIVTRPKGKSNNPIRSMREK